MPTRNPIPEDVLRELSEEQRLTPKAIGRLLGRSHQTVAKYMDEYGIARRRAPEVKLSDWLTRELLHELYVARGLSIPAICEMYHGLHPGSVQQLLVRYDIPRRPPGVPISCSDAAEWVGAGDMPRRKWLSIRNNAAARKLEFTITPGYVWSLIQKQCFRCALSGVPIRFAASLREYKKDPSCETASLDRINSDGGYVVGNVQWTHSVPNSMKSDRADDEFVRWCVLVADYHRGLRSC